MQEEDEQATEDTADPNLTPPRSDFPRPPTGQEVGQSAAYTAAQAESQASHVTMDDSFRSDAPAVGHQEEEPSSAVSSTPEGEEKEEEEAQGEGAQMGASGMQGSVAESSASSNARQQSTSSAASSVGELNMLSECCCMSDFCSKDEDAATAMQCMQQHAELCSL